MVISTFVGFSMVSVIDRDGEIVNFENKDTAMEVCKTMCEYDIDPSNASTYQGKRIGKTY